MTTRKPDPPDFDVREQAAYERLGTNTPVCVCCPENDWRCLELHHIAGKAFDSTTVILCRNCHRKLSDSQRDHPTKLTAGIPASLECFAHMLHGLADFFLLLAQKFREMAYYLIEQVIGALGIA